MPLQAQCRPNQSYSLSGLGMGILTTVLLQRNIMLAIFRVYPRIKPMLHCNITQESVSYGFPTGQ